MGHTLLLNKEAVFIMKSEINKIASGTDITSTTSPVDEKHKMKVVDKIVSLSGNKQIRSTVENLVDKMLKSEEPTEQLSRFKALLDNFIPLKEQAKFSVVITVDKEKGTWDYHFVIDEMFVRNNEEPQAFVSNDDVFLDFFKMAYPQDNQLLDELQIVLFNLFKKNLDLAELAFSMTVIDQSSSNPNTPDSTMAEKLAFIAEQYPDVHFVLEIEKGKSYKISIEFMSEEGNPQYRQILTIPFSPSVNDEDPLAFAKLWAVKIKMNTDFELYQDRNGLTIETLIEGNIECMADDETEQAAIRLVLNNPAYNSDNFVGIKKHSDSNRMIAVFKEGRELVFSNRTSTSNELRGARLTKYLQGTTYKSLYDIVSVGFKTEQDALFVTATGPSKHDFLDKPLEKFSQKDQEQIKQQLAVLPVGNTTFGKLWRIDTSTTDPKPSSLLPPEVLNRRV